MSSLDFLNLARSIRNPVKLRRAFYKANASRRVIDEYNGVRVAYPLDVIRISFMDDPFRGSFIAGKLILEAVLILATCTIEKLPAEVLQSTLGLALQV